MSPQDWEPGKNLLSALFSVTLKALFSAVRLSIETKATKFEERKEGWGEEGGRKEVFTCI